MEKSILYTIVSKESIGTQQMKLKILKLTLFTLTYLFIIPILSILTADIDPDVQIPTPEAPPSSASFISLHNKGVEGNKKAVNQAYEILEKLIESEPNNPVLLVYKGSCLTLKARDAFWPPKKLDFAREGFGLMDKAAEQAPNNLEVRFIRGMCGLSVPKFFKRLDESIDDFNFLITTYESSQNKDMNGAMVYYHAAQAYIKDNNKEKASNLLKKSIAADSGNQWKLASEKLLDKL